MEGYLADLNKFRKLILEEYHKLIHEGKHVVAEEFKRLLEEVKEIEQKIHSWHMDSGIGEITQEIIEDALKALEHKLEKHIKL